MPIFKKRNKNLKEDERLVGVMISQQVCYYLNLYSIVNEFSKSLVLRNLIYTWYKEIKKEHPTDQLATTLLELVRKRWHIQKIINQTQTEEGKKISFNGFKRELNMDLMNRGIDQAVIDRTINLLKE